MSSSSYKLNFSSAYRKRLPIFGNQYEPDRDPAGNFIQHNKNLLAELYGGKVLDLTTEDKKRRKYEKLRRNRLIKKIDKVIKNLSKKDLTDLQFKVLVLWRYGAKCIEISRMLGVKEPQVWVVLKTVCKKVQEKLEK
jgi:DNA-binding CsgD family transcriptional regulator